ncbi:MAG TPA: hypothetical protein DCR45_05650, partial [Gammaproteobacteria bacterium]|nr:hypothetical protein [Gammaproteobacteria bacterium]
MANEIKRLNMKDLESNRDEFLSELYTGLKEYGFVVLRDHKINRNKLDRAYALLQELFNLP